VAQPHCWWRRRHATQTWGVGADSWLD
jgi:hypothetical protein